ncbi:hypothetical protein [Luteitalea pratensis]|uniref:hypothetical protein n=1 Tax=Luteitalea pratensis TaxID=1855912 RepID=UPI003AAADCB6
MLQRRRQDAGDLGPGDRNCVLLTASDGHMRNYTIVIPSDCTACGRTSPRPRRPRKSNARTRSGHHVAFAVARGRAGRRR